MGRLTRAQWEQVRADYEVKGVSFTALAERHHVDRAAISRRAKKEGWIKGKSHALVERKVTALKEVAAVEAESHALPARHQHTLESVVRERLQAEGLMAELDVALAQKGLELVQKIRNPEEYELIARGRRHLAPQQAKTETKVTVTQQQAIQPLTPAEALRQIVKKRDGDAADA